MTPIVIDFRSRDGHPIRMFVPYLKNELYTPRRGIDNILSKTCKDEKAVVLLGPGGTGLVEICGIPFDLMKYR